MLFQIILFLTGCFSVYRILCELHEQSYACNRHMTKIGTICFLVIFVCCFCFSYSFVFRSLSVFAMILILICLPEFLMLVADLQMEKYLPNFLRQLHFQMQLGKSFRTSFREIIDSETNLKRKKAIEKFYENVVFTQQDKLCFRSKMLLISISELKNIDKTSISAQKRLKNLYEMVKINADFRRRSGKVLIRMRVQSIFIGVLFLLALFFSVQFFGNQWLSKFLIPSTAMMVIGIAWTLLIGRRIQWNI